MNPQNSLTEIPKSLMINSLINRNRKRKTFSKEEDARLLFLVKYYGNNQWHKVSALMPFRSVRQCKERYEGYLSPSVNHENFSNDEDILLFEKYKIYGSKWKLISSFFHGRSGNQLKNRWNTYVSKLTEEEINNIKQKKSESPKKAINEAKKDEDAKHIGQKKEESIENIFKLYLNHDRYAEELVYDESLYFIH